MLRLLFILTLTLFPLGQASAQGKQAREIPNPAFDKIDKNSDGNISQQEFLVQYIKQFQEMDSNGDGQLDKIEFFAGNKGKMYDSEKIKEQFEKIRENKKKEKEAKMEK